MPDPQSAPLSAPLSDPQSRMKLEQFPGYVLRRAANAMMNEFAARLSPLDLRISEVSVLVMLGDRRGLTSAEIGKALDIQRANMVPLLGRLEAAGLIERHPIDGRSMAVMLTETGLSRLAQARAIVEAFEQELLFRIPAEHRDHFMPALLALWKPAPDAE